MEPENVLIAPTRSAAGIKLLLASLFGIAIFFIPFELAGRSTIMVDHLAGFLIAQRPLAVGLILLLIGYGAITPLLDGRWRARPIDRLLSLFKLIGLVLALMYVANLGPAWLMTPDRLPFLFDKLAMSVGLIVPIGAMALTFLLGFGLLELIGVLMQPVMRPLWRTPGHSAIDAVASFVGSYSVGLLITNRVFLAGKYTVREAVIIATGFSTVSAAFMIIVAKTLNLMEHWNFYFWSTLVITFVITAILARVPPISNMAHHGKTDEPLPAGKNRWQAALTSGLTQSSMAQPVLRQLQDNLKDGLLMAAAVVPTILSVGLLGLLLAQHTPLFDLLGWLLWPLTWLLELGEPLETARALSAGLAEMFLPAILLKDADLLVRYVTAVVSVSSVLFFSASIPCILATKIPVSVSQLVVIWLLRTLLGIVLAALCGKLAMAAGWLS
ncbi:transmembrane protein [Aeromonas salmonicida]|uniref:YjiH family protein n=1 Tax=Aeromonas salmonicida TaxID=645 RepID=UPI0010252692|nr:YjiH family protein [Aeromonas salmonicida]VFB10312.1 transmembrane protein [Aeromonas salmonicida]